MTRVLSLVFLLVSMSSAQGMPVLRVGVLKFGTASWELALIQQRKFDHQAGFSLHVVEVASSGAAAVALLAGEVDVIVKDWLWVLEQNRRNKHLRYIPYSSALGGLVASPASGIDGLAQLPGKRLGVAGGPTDKNWLLLRYLLQRQLGGEALAKVEVRFGAAPLLSRMLSRGQLDAVLNYWHYNARLVAAGMREVLPARKLLSELGIPEHAPILGWVFDGEWAQQHPERVRGFNQASFKAKQVLAHSAAAWRSLRPLMKAEDEAVFSELVAAYRLGIPRSGPAERAAAGALARLLATLQPGRDDLQGDMQQQLDTIWWREGGG